MEINKFIPYLNNKTKVYVFDSPIFLKSYLSKYPDGVAFIEVNIDNFNEIVIKDKYKPVLRPLSDLYGDFLEKLNDEFGYDGYQLYFEENTLFEISDHVRYTFANPNCFPYFVNRFLFENHFDIFGLIDEGLAIDVNDFDIDVYA